MSTTIHLKSGHTLTFERRRYGTVILLNGTLWCGLERFLLEMIEVHAERGESVNELLAELGIPDDGTCVLCDRPVLRTRCPVCDCVDRCAACARSHDHGSLCRLTREAADIHRQMRGGDVLDSTDRYFAMKSMAPSYLRGPVQ
jgi:hypothetical protein